jgi:hypothetical protein
MYVKIKDFILSKRGAAVGVAAALVTTLVVGSFHYDEFLAGDKDAATPDVDAAEVEVVDTEAPVLTLNDNIIYTSDVTTVDGSVIASYQDESPVEFTIDKYVKISDPTEVNDETKQGFVAQLSQATDQALIDELAAVETSTAADIAPHEVAPAVDATTTDATTDATGTEAAAEATGEATAADATAEASGEEAATPEMTPANEGIYTAVLTATDANGNFSARPILVVYDVTAPVIAHDTSDEKRVVEDIAATPEVTVGESQITDTVDGIIAPDRATVDVAEKVEDAESENTDSKKSAEDVGIHVFTVNITVADRAGNTAVLTYDLSLYDQSTYSSASASGNASSGGSSGSSGSNKSSSSGSNVNKSSGSNAGEIGTATAGESSCDAPPAAEPANIYKYCPTSINGTVLYCSNEATPGQVKDGIYIGGSRVLTTSSGSWDSVQVCDPTVIQGDFYYQGSNYCYLMAYLGCATYDCTANEVGLAVSNNLWSWTKVGRAIGAAHDGFWGVGQPSLISYNGNIILFYTSGTASCTTTYARQLLSTNLDSILLSDAARITVPGDFVSNADFAFSGNTLYMTCDTHPFPSGTLNFISGVQSVYSGTWDGTLSGLSSIGWSKVAAIGGETTGHKRNHNGCFVRDGYGGLSSREIYVSVADEVGNWSANLYTYRFMRVAF